MRRLAPWLGGLAGCLVCVGLAAAQGSPSPTTWTEQLSLSASDSAWGGFGTDDLAPEDILEGVGKDGASAAGYVVFGAPQPAACSSVQEIGPRGAVLITAAVLAGVPVDASAGLTAEFQFRIVQTSDPPVPVAEVPVTAEVCGTVETGGDPSLVATSYASIAIWHFVQGFPTYYLVNATANADINPATEFPTSDSFQFQRTEPFPVGAILDGRLVTGVSCYSPLNPTEAGQATTQAFVDPVIEVADQTIPGSSAGYRDHFAIEFGAGYYALDPTPVEPTTWGRLKVRFKD